MSTGAGFTAYGSHDTDMESRVSKAYLIEMHPEHDHVPHEELVVVISAEHGGLARVVLDLLGPVLELRPTLVCL